MFSNSNFSISEPGANGAQISSAVSNRGRNVTCLGHRLTYSILDAVPPIHAESSHEILFLTAMRVLSLFLCPHFCQ